MFLQGHVLSRLHLTNGPDDGAAAAAVSEAPQAAAGAAALSSDVEAGPPRHAGGSRPSDADKKKQLWDELVKHKVNADLDRDKKRRNSHLEGPPIGRSHEDDSMSKVSRQADLLVPGVLETSSSDPTATHAWGALRNRIEPTDSVDSSGPLLPAGVSSGATLKTERRSFLISSFFFSASSSKCHLFSNCFAPPFFL